MESVAFVIIVAVAILTTVTNVKAQVITFDDEPIETNSMNLSIIFSNGSKAGLLNEPITEEQGNTIVAAINAILLNDNDHIASDNSEIISDYQDSVKDIEEEEESDNSGGDGDGNGNNNDNNDNGDDNDNGDEDEPEPEPEPIPEPIEPIIIPGPPEDEEEDELELEVITKGCFGEGLGYHRDGPYKCYPIDRIGEDPPEGTMYCAALGCPYNPPDLSKD